MPRAQDPRWERRAVGKDAALAYRVRFTPQCWTWKGRQLVVRRGGRVLSPARLAFELAYGALPAGSCVLRNCTEPRCVRPTHHRPGERADAVAQALRIGRAKSGAPSPRAVLTQFEVLMIRMLHVQGVPLLQLARQFGVTKECVRKIVKRRTWVGVEP